VCRAIRSQSGPGASVNHWLFTGEQHDADSELYYLRARYYDPESGRFLSRDPLPGGQPYAYAGGNPINRVDPSGLTWSSTIGWDIVDEEDKESAPKGLQCSIEAHLKDVTGFYSVNRIELRQTFVYDGSRILRVDEPVVTGRITPRYWHSSDLSYRWYWRDRGRLARSEARVTWKLTDPVLGIVWRTIDVWIFIDFSAEGWCQTGLVY
jgi:RHS repeat-associated protein